MKGLYRVVWFAIIVAIMAVSCHDDDDDAESNVKVGDTLPKFQSALSDGTKYDSSAQPDCPTLIVFFHTECTDCQKELPVLQELYDSLRTDFRLILISREEPDAEVATYWRQNNLTMPYQACQDRSIYNMFSTSGIPRGYLCDRQNKVTYLFSDKDMPDFGQLKKQIVQLNERI